MHRLEEDLRELEVLVQHLAALGIGGGRPDELDAVGVARRLRRKHAAEAAEPLQQLLGDGLRVAPVDREEEEKLEQLVVGEATLLVL